jgi:hypothetical protein
MPGDLTLLTLSLSFILDVTVLNTFHENRKNFKNSRRFYLTLSKKNCFNVMDLQLFYTFLGEDLSQKNIDN